MEKKRTHAYENNPFYIGLNGLKLLFSNAQSVAIYAIVLCALGFVGSTATNISDAFDSSNTVPRSQLSHQRSVEQQRAIQDFFSQDPGKIVVAGVIIASVAFIVILVMLLLNGVLEYTGAQLAFGKKVSLGEAFKEVLKDLAGYLWMNIIMVVKILLWSLLLIVPGVIMAVRYKLAGTVFFAEGKRGNAAIKRSLELTKGAWFTTVAGYGLWNLITFNQIQSLLMPGTSAILYRQLRDVTDAGEQKPPAHWLSWLTFFVPIALAVLFIGLFVLLLVFLAAITP